nr:hypothetical protein [Tanacetum cinerariifolium]
MTFSREWIYQIGTSEFYDGIEEFMKQADSFAWSKGFIDGTVQCSCNSCKYLSWKGIEDAKYDLYSYELAHNMVIDAAGSQIEDLIFEAPTPPEPSNPAPSNPAPKGFFICYQKQMRHCIRDVKDTQQRLRRNLIKIHDPFAAEPRNVRLGLCTDGFTPFGMSSTLYSCWPVIVTPYNLRPWMFMKIPYMFLTLIIPGPHSPKKNIDVFLQPLIDELYVLWKDGVDMYDAFKERNFNLKAALMWTINDFPAYGMLSGWSTHGRLSCPYCMKKSKNLPGFGVCHNWTKKSILWDLPYWKTNLIRHNLDVMHVEKNVFDKIFNTVMDDKDKTKDNVKARQYVKEYWFFDHMEHLLVHLSYEARVGGPEQYRWMYPFERYLYHLKKKVKNKAWVVSSICEAYIMEEISNLCIHYFESRVETNSRRVGRNDDGGNLNPNRFSLSIFNHPGRTSGTCKRRYLDDDEYAVATFYVLQNYDEMKPLIRKFEAELKVKMPNVTSVQLIHAIEEKFRRWIRDYVLNPLNSNLVNDNLKSLAIGPSQHAQTRKLYYVNVFNFHTMHHSFGQKTSNTDLCIVGEEGDYYGQLNDVIELEYMNCYKIRMTGEQCVGRKLEEKLHDDERDMEAVEVQHLQDHECEDVEDLIVEEESDEEEELEYENGSDEDNEAKEKDESVIFSLSSQMETEDIDQQLGEEDRRIVLTIQGGSFNPSNNVTSTISSIWKSRFTGAWIIRQLFPQKIRKFGLTHSRVLFPLFYDIAKRTRKGSDCCRTVFQTHVKKDRKTFVDSEAKETWEKYMEKYEAEDTLDKKSGNIANIYIRWADHVGSKKGKFYGLPTGFNRPDFTKP